MIDKVLLEKAELYGIDLQTFVELKLYEYITGRESIHKSNSLKYSDIKDDFEKWLKNRVSRETAEEHLRALSSLDGITPESLIQLYQSRPSNNRAKAIRNLINYLEDKNLISSDFAEKVRKALPIKSR